MVNRRTKEWYSSENSLASKVILDKSTWKFIKSAAFDFLEEIQAAKSLRVQFGRSHVLRTILAVFCCSNKRAALKSFLKLIIKVQTTGSGQAKSKLKSDRLLFLAFCPTGCMMEFHKYLEMPA